MDTTPPYGAPTTVVPYGPTTVPTSGSTTLLVTTLPGERTVDLVTPNGPIPVEVTTGPPKEE